MILIFSYLLNNKIFLLRVILILENLISMHNATLNKKFRASRFSQNPNVEQLKNFQRWLSSEGLEQNDPIIQETNCAVAKVSSNMPVISNEKRSSKAFRNTESVLNETNEQQFNIKQSEFLKNKYYDPEQINKFKQSMLLLPNLMNKNKKIKFKHITIELISFIFHILRNTQIIQKILASYISHQAVLNQFLTILDGFLIKNFQSKTSIQIENEQDNFYIILEGTVERALKRDIAKASKKLSYFQQCKSQTSIIGRSKLKNKSITQKGKIVCLDDNLPVLINEQHSIACTIKTSVKCCFLLLNKGIWSKFLKNLQKLEEKYMVGFIADYTTINLNFYTNRENKSEKQDQKVIRKRFLEDLKQVQQSSHCSDDNETFQNRISDQKQNILLSQTNSSSYSSYILIDLPKDYKITINNQDAYLIAKGSLYLNSKLYEIVLNEGSIINTSILLSFTYQEVHAKALSDCVIVKLILSQIYFQKSDQKEFIEKIKQIESFRLKVNHKPNKQILPIQTAKNTLKKTYKKQDLSDLYSLPENEERSRDSNNKQNFQPKQLCIKELSFIKGEAPELNNFKKARINRKIHLLTEGKQNNQNYQKKSSISKFVNNYCIFEKIVKSQQAVIDSYNFNKIKKYFPNDDRLKHQTFDKCLETNNCHQKEEAQQKLKNQTKSFKIKNFDHTQTQNIDQKNQNRSKIIKKSQAKQERHDKLENVQRREQFGRYLLDKKKIQKNKIISNLFQISQLSQQMIEKYFNTRKKKQKANSLDFLKNKIQFLVKRNSEMKLKQQNSSRFYVELNSTRRESLPDTLFNNYRLSKCKYNTGFLFTQPNYNQVFSMQNTISDHKFHSEKTTGNMGQTSSQMQESTCQKFLSNKFLKLKKKNTKRILMTMLTGRIRQSKTK